MNVDIRAITPHDARDVAELHVQGIASGFISSLGHEFVSALYEAIADSSFGFGFVAYQQNTVIGFVAFTTHVGALYKSVIRKKGLWFIWLIMTKMFRWSRIKRAFETLFYPSRIKHLDLPDAELLSIVVTNQARGQGIARKLIETGLAECRQRQIDKIKVLVADKNTAANHLYRKCNFKQVVQILNHYVPSNIYIIHTLNK